MGWLVLLVLLAVQVAGLYAPTQPSQDQVPGLDKVQHLLGFGVPALVAWLLGARRLVGLMVIHALVSEPLQHAVAPTRQLDPLDTVADLVGIGLGVLVARAVRRSRGHDGGMPSSVEEG